MAIKIYKFSLVQGDYLLVGRFREKLPIYVGPKPPVDWIAMPTDNEKGVCINNLVYNSLRRHSNFIEFLEEICSETLNQEAIYKDPNNHSKLYYEILAHLYQDNPEEFPAIFK